jgi:PAS domain S-box-containing protein
MNSSPSKILVADDDVRGLLYLKGLLHSEGYELLVAKDGPTALELAQNSIPDAILLDVMMPGMDGFEVCRRLRVHPKLSQIPIILLTALDDRESKLDGLQAGADDFLTKPFDATELLLRLKTITRLNRFRRISEERARFEEVVNFSPDGIVVMDESGTIQMANHEFARVAGMDSPQTIVGQCFFDWLNESDARAVRVLMKESTHASHSALEIHIGGAVDNDEGTPVEITVGRVMWEGISVYLASIRDASEKKRLESQVMRFQRIELLGELAGGVAHDMNNVLSAVSGNLALFEMQMELNAEAKTRIQMIQQSIQRGNGILRQLLSFTRGSDGTLQPVAISTSIQEVVDLITPMMKYHFQIKTVIADPLPLIEADANQLHQILMNLCVNARDAMGKGGTLTISAEAGMIDQAQAAAIDREAKPGHYLRLMVQDTGTGMTQEVKDKIFAPFFTTKPPGKGTGLGLATVMRLTRRHKGFVTVETELGKGTCFICHFPVLS